MLEKASIAIVDFNQCLLINKNYIEAYYYRGLAHHKQRNLTFSYEDLLYYKQNNPTQKQVLIQLMNLSEEMEEINQSIQFATEYLSLDPKSIDVLKKRALYYSNLNQYQKAIVDLDECIKINSNDTNTWIMKGNIYFDASDFLKAIEAYNIVLLQYPENLNVLEHKADALLSNRNYDEAIKTYRSLLILKTSDNNYLFNIGFSYLQLENYKEAIIFFNKVIENNPENIANALTLRGAAYQNLNLKLEACADWKKAVSIGFKDAQKYLDNYCN